jgi:hypothetical protein
LIALRKFGGEIPLLPAHLLPEGFAQQAINCDFSEGHLRPLKDGLLQTTLTGTIRSVYTEDGVNWLSFTHETPVFKSPILGDTFNRLYYLDASGVLRVTTTVSMIPAGGPPASSFKVGVPQPSVAPTLALVERTTLPDYPGAAVEITCWLEDAGVRYQETTPSSTEVSAYRTYTFNIPTPSGATPTTALPKARIRFLDSGRAFMTITVGPTDGEVRSSALPGGVTATLAPNTLPNYRLTLTYGVVETRAYVYTNANTWNEESGTSPASTIPTTYMQDVQVTMTASTFTDYRPFQEYRAYRTTGGVATYLRVYDDATASFQDTSHKPADFGDPLETLEYEAPPALLSGLVMLPGGVLAGYNGVTLYFSEQYRPHAWGTQLAMRALVRGMLVLPQSLLVTTSDGCYLVQGAKPSQMVPYSLGIPQAGIAMRSMANLDGMGVFASQDGIVSVNGSRATLELSQRLFNRETWQADFGTILADASMRFAWHDGALVATSANAAKGFVLRFDEASAGLYTQLPKQVDSMTYLPVLDTSYYSVGSNLYRFGAGANLSYTWHSNEYLHPRPVSMGAGLLRASGAVTMTVYADEVSVFSGSVAPGYFRLPGGRAARRWTVKLEGTATVEELYIARSMRELQSV